MKSHEPRERDGEPFVNGEARHPGRLQHRDREQKEAVEPEEKTGADHTPPSPHNRFRIDLPESSAMARLTDESIPEAILRMSLTL